jgi:ABC-type polysaccharide/polyol phosphate transport system ATPase subunit
LNSELYAIDVQNVVKKFRIYHKEKTIFDKLLNIVNRGTFSEDLILFDHISFSVHRGETLGIIGRNGSGKTTLLRLIANIMRPDKGIIRTKGSIIPLLELGTGFDGDLVARDNIIQYGTILGLKSSNIKDKVEEILRFAELEKFANTKIKKFSSGMIAKLAFCTAVQVRPDILLVDEVLSVGDLAFRQKSYKAFTSFKEENRTIVLVSHDMQAIRQLCDRAILLHDGKIKSIGEPEKVIDAYLGTLDDGNRYTVQIKTDHSQSANLTTDGNTYTKQKNTVTINEIRQMIDNRNYATAIVSIREILNNKPNDGYIHYLFALCLHNLKIDHFKALYHYNLALENGFNEFWILYNRGLLYSELGDAKAAISDLKHAVSLNPSHQGAKVILKDIADINEKQDNSTDTAFTH